MATAAIIIHDDSVEGTGIRIPASAYTLDGFHEWAESEGFPNSGRVSFIDGEIHLDMSPEEIETHNKVKGLISRVVSTLVDDLDLGEFYYDRTLVTNRKAALSTEPDATFVSWSTLESGRVKSIQRKDHVGEYTRIEGTPDWVLEVVSRSSYQKDTQTLLHQYHQAGISEYWLVDATGEDIDFQILSHEKNEFVSSRTEDAWHKSVVFGRWFRMRREETRLQRWRYKLDMKE